MRLISFFFFFDREINFYTLSEDTTGLFPGRTSWASSWQPQLKAASFAP